MSVGTVHFIGAGPGAADLLTLRGAAIIAASPVCVYAGALVPPAVLEHCPEGVRLVDTQHLTLDQITSELVDASRRGEDVARLHSGDLSIYSAVTEQLRRLDEAGVPWTMTPGVPAYAAAASALGRELTVPGVAQSIILTRHSRQATAMPPGEELAALAAHGTTLVLHLATQALDELAPLLAEHYGAGCPVAVVARASWPDELVLRGTLATIAQLVAQAELKRTATILVGPALAGTDADGACLSHLYSPQRDRRLTGGPAPETDATSGPTGAQVVGGVVSTNQAPGAGSVDTSRGVGAAGEVVSTNRAPGAGSVDTSRADS